MRRLLPFLLVLLVPAAAARSTRAAALVVATSAVRFGVTGVAELHGGRSWLQAAGAVGLVLAVVSFYAALALELEDSSSRTVLPVGGAGRWRGFGGSLERGPALSPCPWPGTIVLRPEGPDTSRKERE